MATEQSLAQKAYGDIAPALADYSDRGAAARLIAPLAKEKFQGCFSRF